MLRRLVWMCVCCGLLLGQDPTADLVKLLESKGLLTAAEVAQLRGGGVAELARLLEAKGVLTSSETASLIRPRVEAPVVARTTTPAQPAPAKPAPAKPSATVAAPQASGVVETTAKLPVTLYGAMMMSSFANLSGLNILDVPLFNNKAGVDALGNDKSFGMTFRQSRLGLRIAGRGPGGTKLMAVVEGDFFGGKAALPPGEHMEVPRLRLAFVRLDGKKNSLVIGQDWTVFAPLNPVSYAAYSIPAYAGGGNPWIRLPQLRYERTGVFAGDTEFTWQVAITDPNLGDHPTNAFITARTPGIGERGQMPGFENRLQIRQPLAGRTLAVGVSGRYGRGLNSALINNQARQQHVDSWGTSVDYSIPLWRNAALVGEAYAGRALGGYSSAIGMSVLPPGGPGGGGVFSRGGWTQLQYQAFPALSFNFAFGIDTMRARDLRVGDRISNGGPMINTIYKFNSSLSTALEWRRLSTKWYRSPSANESGEQISLGILWLL